MSLLLQTARLTLRCLRPDDWPFFLELQQNPSVLRYVSAPRTEAELARRFEARLAPWDKEADDWLTLLIELTATGARIGLHGFRADWQPYQQAELGFLLAPEHQGQGYAREATRAVVSFAIRTCGFHKLTASVTRGNERSAHLLRQVGFSEEGCLRHNYQIGGEWVDDLKFGLLASEWPAVPDQPYANK